MNTVKHIVPSATLSETPDAFELKFTVPGIGKGDIDLHIEGKTLTLAPLPAFGFCAVKLMK